MNIHSVSKANILGVGVNVLTLDLACRHIADWIERKNKTYVCVATVSTIVDCQEDKRYKEVVNGAGMITPDGMPLVWVATWQGIKGIKRTYGPDLMLAFCQMSEKKGYKHYFYGGSLEACRLLETRLKERFPRINIVGKISPPFRHLTSEEDLKMVEEINRSNPDVLWVGLGSPKQDYWMCEHRSLLNVPVMIGVGAAFDFLAGTKPQAPKWMQSIGLEWFFRLCCEPKRLWRRYLIGNSKFIYYLLQDCFTNLRSSR